MKPSLGKKRIKKFRASSFLEKRKSWRAVFRRRHSIYSALRLESLILLIVERLKHYFNAYL